MKLFVSERKPKGYKNLQAHETGPTFNQFLTILCILYILLKGHTVQSSWKNDCRIIFQYFSSNLQHIMLLTRLSQSFLQLLFLG